MAEAVFELLALTAGTKGIPGRGAEDPHMCGDRVVPSGQRESGQLKLEKKRNINSNPGIKFHFTPE